MYLVLFGGSGKAENKDSSL